MVDYMSGPSYLITEQHVRETLKADRGEKAKLMSWHIQDFTQKGDNLVGYVTSIAVKYAQLGKVSETSYVAKLNAGHSVEYFNDISDRSLSKEANFYTQLVPELNAILKKAEHHPLRVPACYYCNKEEGNHILFLEDLRTRGFRMVDRRKGMDFNHSMLVVKELARLHGASSMLQKKYPNQDIADRHTLLQEDWPAASKKERNFMNEFISKNCKTAIAMLEHIGGHNEAVDWLRKAADTAIETVDELIKRSPPFEAICHGDVWTNNILFRYNNVGDPIEVMFVDFALARVASVNTDINQFLLSSLDGDVRVPNMQLFLKTYMDIFKTTFIEDEGIEAPFTYEQFLANNQSKLGFGILWAIIIIPFAVLDPEDMVEVDAIFVEKTEDQEAKVIQNAVNCLEIKPLLKPRFLAVFEEMEKAGVF